MKSLPKVHTYLASFSPTEESLVSCLSLGSFQGHVQHVLHTQGLNTLHYGQNFLFPLDSTTTALMDQVSCRHVTHTLNLVSA